MDRHLRKMRLTYRHRRDALVAALNKHLPVLRVHGVAAGLHLMVELPQGIDENDLICATREQSIAQGVRRLADLIGLQAGKGYTRRTRSGP